MQPTHKQAAFTEGSHLASTEVLIVEDNEINQIIIKELLEALNQRVTLAKSGAEAIEKVMADPQQFKIIFMDCQMPEMDGFEATRHIQIGRAHV